MDDQRPAPRFAVGQMVLTRLGGSWVGPLRVTDVVVPKIWSRDGFGRPPANVWHYSVEPVVTDIPRALLNAIEEGRLCPEPLLRPYDPPADQSYDELMRRLTDPNEYQRNLERDYLTEQYGEPV